jgi:hypothetical protein
VELTRGYKLPVDVGVDRIWAGAGATGGIRRIWWVRRIRRIRVALPRYPPQHLHYTG